MEMPERLSFIFKATLFDRDPTLEEQDVIDQALRWVGGDKKRPGLFLTRPLLYFISKGAGGLNQELLPPGAERQGQSGGLRPEGARPVLIPEIDYPGVPFEILPRLIAAQAVDLFREHKAGSRLGPDPNMLTETSMITDVNYPELTEEQIVLTESQRRLRASYAMRLLRYMDARLKVENKRYIHFDMTKGRSELKQDKGSYNSGQSVGIALEENPDTVVQVIFKARKFKGQIATKGQFRDSVIKLCRLLAEKEDIGSLPMTFGDRMVVHFTRGMVPLSLGEVYQAMGDVGGRMVGGRSAAQGTSLDYKDMEFLDCIAVKESFVGLKEAPFMFAFSLHIQPRAPRSSASSPGEGGHKINKTVASGLAITPLTKQFSHGYDDHPEVVLYRAGDLVQKAVTFYRLAGLIEVPDISSIEPTMSERAVEAFAEMRRNQPKEGKLGDIRDAILCHAVSEGRDAILHFSNNKAVLCLNRDNVLTNLRQTNEMEILCKDLGIDDLTIQCTIPNTELATTQYSLESEESLGVLTVIWDDLIVRLNRIPEDSWRQWSTLALIADDSIRPERYSMGNVAELYYDEVVQGAAQAVMAYDEDNTRTIVYAPRTLDAVVIGFDIEGKRPQNGEIGNMIVALMDTERVKMGKKRRKTEIFYPLGTISTLSGFTVENRRGIFEHLMNHVTHTMDNIAFVNPLKANLILRIEYDGFANQKMQTTYRLKHQRAKYDGPTFRPEPEGALGTLPGQSTDYNLDRLVGLGGGGMIDIGPSYLIEHSERRMPTLRNPRVLHLSSFIRSLSDLLEGDPKMVAAFGKKRGKGKDATFDTGVPLAQINPPYDRYPGGITQMIADQIRMGSLKHKPQGRTFGWTYKELDPNWKQKYPLLAGRLEEAANRGFKVQLNPPTIPFSIEYDGEGDDLTDSLSVKDLLDRSLERKGTEKHPMSKYGDYNLYGKKDRNDWEHFDSDKELPADYTDWQYRPPLPNPYPRFTAHRQEVPWKFDQDIFDGSSFRTLKGKKFNQTRGMLNRNKRYSDLYDQGIAVQAIVGKIDGKWAVQSYRVPKQHKTRRLKREIQLDDAKAPKWYQKKHPASAPYGQKAKAKEDATSGLAQVLANPLVMTEPTIIAFCGPSGSGKSTVAAHLEERLPGAEIILSYTTRDRRPDEVDGFDKNFVTKESFEEMIENGLFTTPKGVKLYQQQANGHYYGRRYDELMGTQYPIVDVSFTGLRQLREAFGENMVFSVFLKNKLTEERRFQIMMQRGEMTEAEARQRAMVGSQMMKDYKRYDFDAVVENKFGRLYQTGTRVKEKLFKSIDAKDNPHPEKITPKYVRSHPKTLFVFGDNDLRQGKKGQAQIRDESNTVGIRTKKAPKRNKSAYYTDTEYDANVKKLKEDLKNISKLSSNYDNVYFIPGIGEGLAELPKRAPKTFAWLKRNMAIKNPPGIPKPGKELSLERKREIRKRWLELVNMTHKELKRFYDSDLGNKRAGLSRDEAKEAGISSGRDSALAIMKMKQTPVKDWHKTRSKDRGRGIMLDFWQWAQKQINFNTRHRSMKGAYLDDKGRPKRKLLGLWIWGHDPWRYALKVDPEPMPPCPDVSWVGSREKSRFGIVEVEK
tara:strand:- start:2813 stop:7606 length:4794 start_codon:yes stop_codon:yes gene_type:complete